MSTRSLFNHLGALAVAAAFAGCGGSDDAGPPPTGGIRTDPNVSTNVTANETWTKDRTYVLKQHIFVQNGAVLTIQAGTRIEGDQGSSLVATTEGRVDALGTVSEPIVFTSSKAVGSRAAGNWGGIVLLGKARINTAGGSQQIEGFPTGTTGTNFGGTDDTHNCGKLQYVRIEFAGFQLAPNNELNGLTMGGCGSQTSIDFVQVHKGADDGVEIFGGSVNVKHILITQPDDDGLDWDNGWTGKGQFIIVQQGNNVGNRGIEADNHPNSFDLTPRANPTVYNVTLVGGGVKYQDENTAIFLRRGTAGKIYNALAMNFDGGAFDVTDASTVSQYDGGEIKVQNSIFWNDNGSTVAITSPKESADTFDEAAKLSEAANANRAADPQLAAATNLTAPNFKPNAGSPALTGAKTPPGDGFFDASATFVGAIGGTDWTAGWTAYPVN